MDSCLGNYKSQKHQNINISTAIKGRHGDANWSFVVIIVTVLEEPLVVGDAVLQTADNVVRVNLKQATNMAFYGSGHWQTL